MKIDLINQENSTIKSIVDDRKVKENIKTLYLKIIERISVKSKSEYC